MTRSDLAIAINERFSELSQKVASAILDCILKKIADGLSKQGASVNLRGFGIFSVSEKSPARARNPVAGEGLSIGRRKIVKFKASPALASKIEKNWSPQQIR
jgi:integration host factor subunit beta